MKTILAIIGSLMIMVSTAFAETPFFNHESGQWTIEGYRGDMNYCSASTFWDDGSFLTFFVTDKDEAHIVVYNKKWNIIDPVGHFPEYQATIRFFGDYPAKQGTIDYDLKDNQTVVLTNVNTKFLDNWIKYQVMVLVMPGDIGEMKIGLSGTKDAVGLMGDCLNQLAGKTSGQNL